MTPSGMTPSAPRRRRPHPARRARKITGSLSIAGLVVLTGCMAATAKSVLPTGSTASTSVAAQATSATTATTTVTADDDSTSRSATVAAVAATPAAQSNTSTHAS